MPTPDPEPEHVDNRVEPGNLRGAALDLWHSTENEVMLSGPADTGKSWSACKKLHRHLMENPGAQAVIIRKTLNSLYPTIFQTWERVTAGCRLRHYGGQKPEWTDYPNGSRVYYAGMDNPQKALSSERDYILTSQTEEFALDDWQTLVTRCNGRAGNAPDPQLFGECNPGPPWHWIRQRTTIRFLESRHEDNPTIYDDLGNLTPGGRTRMAALDSLTGLLYQRLRLGKWVQAEGAVYEDWDAARNVLRYGTAAFPHLAIPAGWPRYRTVDFGYQNPFVCQWWAVDGDGRAYRYREIYRTKRLVEDHASEILRLTAGISTEEWKRLCKSENRAEKEQAIRSGERIVATVSDHDSEDRETLHRHGVPTIAAYKDITRGIQAVQARIPPAGDGRSRIFFMENSLFERDEELAANRKPVSSDQEIEFYVYPKGVDGKPVKEIPVDDNNHGMDGMRYFIALIDKLAPIEKAPYKPRAAAVSGWGRGSAVVRGRR